MSTSVFVSPLHDPEGLLIPHLVDVARQLKEICRGVVLGVTPRTQENNPQLLAQLAEDEFFRLVDCRQEALVGEDLRQIYAYAVDRYAPETLLHLCFVDRVIFALRSHYRVQFMAEMQALQAATAPLIFQRSQAAWATHPVNYREIEGMATRAGQLLFDRSWDFAWCHLAVTAGQLRVILPRVVQRDFSVCAEIVLHLRQTIQTRDVDWLAWEDPLLFGQDAAELKHEREMSVTEARKRFSYVLPMMKVIHEMAMLRSSAV